MYKPKHLKKTRRPNPLVYVIEALAIILVLILIVPLMARSRDAGEIPEFEKVPTELSEDPTVIIPTPSVSDLSVAPGGTPPVVVEPFEIDFTIAQGALYGFDGLARWCEQAADGMQIDEKYSIRVLGMVESCWQLLSYECYDGETLVQALAKTVTAEIGGLDMETAFSTTRMEEAAVVWCVLNRVDDKYVNGNAEQVTKILKKPHQFAYHDWTKIHYGHEELVVDVIIRWQLEKSGLLEDVGRVLPAEYLFFHGDGKHNWFRINYEDCTPDKYWDWALPDPYQITKA